MAYPLPPPDSVAPIQGAEAVASLPFKPTPGRTRAVYVGVAGNLSLTFLDGSVVIFRNIPVGTHPWAVTAIATSGGTDATDVVALY